MTNEVTILMVQDPQRQAKIITFSQSYGQPIWSSVDHLIGVVGKNEDWDLGDTTIAINIADAIYNYLP